MVFGNYEKLTDEEFEKLQSKVAKLLLKYKEEKGEELFASIVKLEIEEYKMLFAHLSFEEYFLANAQCYKAAFLAKYSSFNNLYKNVCEDLTYFGNVPFPDAVKLVANDLDGGNWQHWHHAKELTADISDKELGIG